MTKEEEIPNPQKTEAAQGRIAGDIELLRQLIDSLDDSVEKLQEFYKEEDPDNFNKTKKFILNLQSKISEVIS